MMHVCPMETEPSVERAYFDQTTMADAAREAMMLYEAPNDTLSFEYQINKIIDGADNASGYIVVRPNFFSSPHVLSQEAPTLSRVMNCLEKLPSSFGRVKNRPMKVPVINVAYPGGEVSRHTDKGDNTNHWIGRCATLQGKGVFHRYDIAGDLLDSEIVEAGDVLTHFNPANATRRLEHDAVTIGDKARISLGLLLPLKRELPWSKRSQAAHATVEG